jgi:hypothetical protein
MGVLCGVGACTSFCCMGVFSAPLLRLCGFWMRLLPPADTHSYEEHPRTACQVTTASGSVLLLTSVPVHARQLPTSKLTLVLCMPESSQQADNPHCCKQTQPHTH